MKTRWSWYLATVMVLLVLLVGLQQLLYPLGSSLSYDFVRSFGSDLLERPVGMAVHNDNVYVADTDHDRIVVFDQSGNVLGTGGETGSDTGEFRRPMRIEAGPDGNLYVADMLNHRIQVFSSQGNFIRSYGNNRATGSASFNQPAGVDVDKAGNLYVVEFAGQRVQKLSPDGRPLASWGVKNTRGYFHHGYFNYPTDVAVVPSGHFYVSDTFNDRIKHYGPDGNRLDVWGGFFGLNIPGPFRGWFKGAYGVAVSRNGRRVYVTDWGNNRVQVFDKHGTYLAMFGSGGSGPGELNRPTDLALGNKGRVYVVDFANDRIQVWERTGRQTQP